MKHYTEEEEFMTADDLEFQDNMRPHKKSGGMSKKERKREKEWRKMRKTARGRKWDEV